MARPLNIRQLEAFRAVMVSGSVTRAGVLLSISQPAVTRLIKDLEMDLGMPLFLRQGPSLVPTPESKEFYREVERYFVNTEGLREAALQIRKRGPTRLRISAFPAIAINVLPDAIAEFLKDKSDTLISIHSGASVDIVDYVLSGRSDMTILARPANRTDLEFFPFPPSEVVCILPANHKLAERKVITPSDLHEEDYIALGANSLMRLELDALLRAANSKPIQRIESLFSSTVVQYVERGLGIGIVDPLVAINIQSDRTVIRRFEPRIAYQPSVVLAPDVMQSESLRDLMRLIILSYEDIIRRINHMLD